MILAEHTWSTPARGETHLEVKFEAECNRHTSTGCKIRCCRSHFHRVHISLGCDPESGSPAAMHYKPSILPMLLKSRAPWANLAREAEGAIQLQCSQAFQLLKAPASHSSFLKSTFYCVEKWDSPSVIFRYTAQHYLELLQGLDWNTLMLSY